MADAVFEQLKKAHESKEELTEAFSVPVSKREYTILKRKADALGMDIGELARVYMIEIQAFDGSYFERKKSAKQNKEEVK